MKSWNSLMLLVGLLLLIAILGIFLEIFNSENPDRKADNSFCGVKSEYPSHYLSMNDSVNINIGKSLFRELCASCHNKNMTDDLTGPALYGAFKRFDSDTLKIFRYLKDPAKYLATENDQRMILLHEEFGKMTKPRDNNLSNNELQSILLFIERIY